jgi:hypothetical protein
MVRWLAAVLLGLSGGGLAMAQPDPGPSALTWTRLAGAEGCINREGLASRVERLVGEGVWDSAGAARVTVDGWVAPQRAPSSGFVVGVALVGDDGEVLDRSMLRTHAARCDVLDEAVARMLARTMAAHAGATAPHPAVATLRDDDAAFSFNPYLAAHAAPQAPQPRARATADEPLPNPYVSAGPPAGDADAPYFNPYVSSPAPTVAQASPPSRRRATPLDAPGFNPYLGAPPPEASPLDANPYRP